MSNQWELLDQSVMAYMQETHKRLLQMVGDDSEFKPKVYMHPLLKRGLLLDDAVQLNGKILEIEEDRSLTTDVIWIMDKSYV